MVSEKDIFALDDSPFWAEVETAVSRMKNNTRELLKHGFFIEQLLEAIERSSISNTHFCYEGEKAEVGGKKTRLFFAKIFLIIFSKQT